MNFRNRIKKSTEHESRYILCCRACAQTKKKNVTSGIQPGVCIYCGLFAENAGLEIETEGGLRLKEKKEVKSE